MTDLASRKSLLLAESELNRAQILKEWELMQGEVRGLAHRAGTLGALVSAAVTLGFGASLFRRRGPAPEPVKVSWLQTILKGAEIVGAWWPKSRRPAG